MFQQIESSYIVNKLHWFLHMIHVLWYRSCVVYFSVDIFSNLPINIINILDFTWQVNVMYRSVLRFNKWKLFLFYYCLVFDS